MDLATALSYFAVLAAFGTVAGVVAVTRYPHEPFAVPVARVTLLLGGGFMLWLGWTCYNDLPDSPLLNWTVVGLGLACGVAFGSAALFGRGERVLGWIEDIRRGF